MAREIVSSKDSTRAQQTPVGAQPDDYKNRLLKYIPAEIVTLYLALRGIIEGRDASLTIAVAWGVIAIGIILTVLHLYRIGKVRKWSQIIISTLAFIVWVLAIGGEPFVTQLNGPDSEAFRNFQLITAVILPVYTFSVALYEP